MKAGGQASAARFGQEPPALNDASVDALERWLPLFATGTAEDIARVVQNEA